MIVPTVARPSDPSRDSKKIILRLMATTDLHAHVLDWDYHADSECFNRGLVRVAGLIGKARAERPSALLFDNGDFLTGNPLGDDWPDPAEKNPLHPMIGAMNTLGYDAATIGNHEFSNGLPRLAKALAQAAFPLVSANFRRKDGTEFLPPYAMIDRQIADETGVPQAIRIGVFGVLPPPTLRWEAAHLGTDFVIEDILEAAARVVPMMRREGADIIVALAHSGLGEVPPDPGHENVARALARLPGVDAVFAGHTHEPYPATRVATSPGEAPIAMAGFFGSHLAVIDLTLRQGEMGWRTVSAEAEARPVARRDPYTGLLSPLVDRVQDLAPQIMAAHERVRRNSGYLIGRTTQRQHSYFALLAPSSTLGLVAAAQIAHVRAALGRQADGVPLLAAVSPFKAGGRGGPENYTDIPEGWLYERHSHDLYPHPNQLVVYRLSGGQLQDWLERSVSLYHRVTPADRDVRLINPDYPGFNFDVLPGLDYQVDLSQPARFDPEGACVAPEACRIGQLRYRGVPIARDDEVLLISNSYRAVGGGGYVAASAQNLVYTSDATMPDILTTYIKNRAEVGDEIGPEAGRWRFAPLGGTSVLFETAPRAVDLLDEIADLHPQPQERLASGFLRFRLWL